MMTTTTGLPDQAVLVWLKCAGAIAEDSATFARALLYIRSTWGALP
jgi:hypothetical protein